MSDDEGLRERSKARRRDLIERTAMRLFAENGYENTTIADIAAAAEVAPRTVSGYFPTKVDLATAYADGVATRVAAAFERGAGGDLFDILDAWLAVEAEILDPELAELATAMYAANPELRAVSTAHVTGAGDLLVSGLVDTVGLPIDHPLIVLSKSALGAALGALIGQLGATPRADRPQLLRDAGAFLRAVVAAVPATARVAG